MNLQDGGSGEVVSPKTEGHVPNVHELVVPLELSKGGQTKSQPENSMVENISACA